MAVIALNFNFVFTLMVAQAAVLNKVEQLNGISWRLLSQEQSKPKTFLVSRFNVACEG